MLGLLLGLHRGVCRGAAVPCAVLPPFPDAHRGPRGSYRRGIWIFNFENLAAWGARADVSWKGSGVASRALGRLGRVPVCGAAELGVPRQYSSGLALAEKNSTHPHNLHLLPRTHISWRLRRVQQSNHDVQSISYISKILDCMLRQQITKQLRDAWEASRWAQTTARARPLVGEVAGCW